MGYCAWGYFRASVVASRSRNRTGSERLLRTCHTRFPMDLKDASAMTEASGPSDDPSVGNPSAATGARRAETPRHGAPAKAATALISPATAGHRHRGTAPVPGRGIGVGVMVARRRQASDASSTILSPAGRPTDASSIGRCCAATEQAELGTSLPATCFRGSHGRTAWIRTTTPSFGHGRTAQWLDGRRHLRHSGRRGSLLQWTRCRTSDHHHDSEQRPGSTSSSK